jgi:predicted ribosome quality control (RQC) complex YloA/Tae2 family protein
LTRIRERPWYDKFRWAILSTGRMALLGKDAHSNEVLLRKYSNENDIVVHSELPGSPFGIVWLKGEPSENEIEELANLVASYTSKAWESGFSSLDVFFVRRSQLSKTPPSGTYLPRGSFFVSGKRNYIKGAKLGIGIAVRKLGNEAELLALSLRATSNFSSYAILKPGNLSASRFIFRLRQA